MTRRFFALLIAPILVLAVAACGNDDNGATEAPTDQGPAGTVPPPASSPTGEPGNETPQATPATETPEGEQDAGDHALMGIQTAVISGSGEVDFEFADSRLTLHDVRPEAGVQHSVEDDPGEIEVDFLHDDGREVDIEIEVEGAAKFDFDVEYDHGAPQGLQTIVLGSAGEVDFEITGGGLQLIEVRPGAGWEFAIDQEGARDIEIDFRHDDGTEIDMEIEWDG